jgi:hypothetical protein
MAEEDQEERALVGESADLGRNGHDKFKVLSSKFKVEILSSTGMLFKVEAHSVWSSRLPSSMRQPLQQDLHFEL